MKKKDLEIIYIASGFAASFRLATPFEDFEKEISKHLPPASQFLKDKLRGNISIAALFNAFTEEPYARRVQDSGTDFKSTFPDGMYADSGGLQVLTRGKVVDKKTKKKIYDTQAKYSDYAMSFDEMPFKMVDGQKIYLPNTVGDCGSKAGKNLKEQISHFNNLKTDTKIIPIVQGLGLKDMKKYTLNMLDELDDDELEKLECLAVGGVQSEFELLERGTNIYRVKGIPKKVKSHFHILGVTGFRKLIPVLIGIRNGLLPGIKKLSFDSTTFTKSYLLGSIQPTLKEMKSGIKKRSLGRKRDTFVEDYYQEIFDFWKDNPDNIFEDAEDMIQHSSFHGQYNNPDKADLPETKRFTTGAQQYKNLGIEHGVKTIVQKYAYVYYNTFKFMEILEGYLEGELELLDFMDGYKQLGLLQALEKIDNLEDYDIWFESVRQSTKVDKPAAQDDVETTSLLF